MNPGTVTRTFVFAALMLELGVAGAYAQNRQGHVEMTFSGTNVATTINLQANTVTDEMLAAGKGSLGRFTFRELHADGTAPPPAGCTGPSFGVLKGAGVFRFQDGSLLIVTLKDGSGCINPVERVVGPHRQLSDQWRNGPFRECIRGTDDDGHPDARAVQRDQRARAPADYGSVRGNDRHTEARKRRPLGDSSPLATGMVAISGHPATLHGIERSQGSVTIVDAVGRLSSTPECVEQPMATLRGARGACKMFSAYPWLTPVVAPEAGGARHTITGSSH